MVTEARLREATGLLVMSEDFCGGGSDRSARVQAAYDMACRIAHILRDDEPTFSAQAWAAFDDWCGLVGDAIGGDFDTIPPDVKAAIFHETDLVEEGIEKARGWIAGHRD